MTETDTETSSVATNWDGYWQEANETGAYSSGGVSHPAILAFWEGFFANVKSKHPHPSMLDIASGNGAVIERALVVFSDNPPEISCVDLSATAIAHIESRFPAVHGMVADACSIPLESASFDIVTSQFGVEYAGEEAIVEAVRLVAEGGQLGFLMHSKAGSIYRVCSDNLEAISRFRQSAFIAGARAMFRAGFDAVRGANREPYDEAARQLTPAVHETEAIMKQFGEQVADDTIARLYADVAQIHAEIQHYDPQEVLSWLERMESELETYEGRMASMIDAAIDETGFENACSTISGLGCQIEQAWPLLAPGNDIPLGWVVVAHRPS